MTKIYLISSVEAEGNLYRVAQGHFDGNITERGRRQLKALEKRFQRIQIDAAYTSDLYRARATAGAICKARGLNARPREELRELYLGAWEGQPWGNIAHAHAEQVAYFQTALDKWRADGAETPEQAVHRMTGAIAQIADENPGKSVVVVSHPLAIRLLLAALQGLPLGRAYELPAGHSSVSLIVSEDGKLRLAELPDAGHLLDEAYQARENPRAELDFNTDMYLHPLPWIEGEIMAQAVETVWEESGEDRPFDKSILLQGLGTHATAIGYVNYEPAGFIQLGMEPGRISLLCTHPGCRRAGLGTQLIGYAALSARAGGAESLYIALPKGNPYRSFFLNLGFIPAGMTEEGREVLEKDLRFDPGMATS